jgi:hypothetical protein
MESVVAGLEFTPWDFLLFGVVAAQSLFVAYCESPKWKSLFLSVPVPFTVIALSVGRPIDASNIFALFVLLAYTQAVRLLHERARVPIVVAIGMSLALYVAIGWACSGIVPTTDMTFGPACAITVLVGLLLHRWFSTTTESSYKTTLPIALKLPVIFAIVAFLISIKHGLAGFAPMFPLVSVVGAYETRYSLWTLARTVPALMVALPPMLIVTRLTQSSIGLGWGLALGWIVFLPLLFWIRRTRLTSAGDERLNESSTA